MSSSRWIHLEVSEVKAETDKAFLLLTEDGEEFWCPKSQISDSDDYSVGDTDCTISISQWFAEKEGIGQ